jgi:hypothetical protein
LPVFFHQQCNDLLLAFDDELLGSLHNQILYKHTPSSHYFKERNRLFINF